MEEDDLRGGGECGAVELAGGRGYVGGRAKDQNSLSLKPSWID